MANNTSFYQAIISGGSNWFSFSARASRFEYWAWFVFIYILQAMLEIYIIDDIKVQDVISNFKIPPLPFVNQVFFVLYILFGIFSFISSTSIGFRRLHDINKSAWWLLLVFIPIIGWIILFYWIGIKKGDASPNRFGEPSNITASGFEVLLLIGLYVLTTILQGKNKRNIDKFQEPSSIVTNVN